MLSNKLQLKHIILYLKEKPEVLPIFPQFTKLVKHLMTIPVSSCTNERSFLTLRRLKNYLRSTMSQDRLNDISMLNIYHEMIDIDTEEVLNEFIKKNNIRMHTFAVI
ncbi:hypothetical protein CAJAP_08750 [Camponotus japonicus]